MELKDFFNKTQEQILENISRVCSEHRAAVSPVVKSCGNLLRDSVNEVLVQSGYACTETILNSLHVKGMKRITKEDLENIADPLLLCIGDMWFRREPPKTVYVYSTSNIPGAKEEKDHIWNCEFSQSLVDFYRENSNKMLILDTDVQRMFDVLYTPAARMKDELLTELWQLCD